MKERRLFTESEKKLIESTLRRDPPLTVPEAGRLCKKLGEQFNRNPSTVMMFAQRRSWIPYAPKQTIKEEHIEAIRKGVEEGKSWAELSKRTGFHPQTCQSVAKKYGIIDGKARPHVWSHDVCRRCAIRKHWPGARYLCTGISK